MVKLTDRIEGAVVGGVLAGVLGQIPPLTVLPEEGISIPAGIALGAILGAKRIYGVVKW